VVPCLKNSVGKKRAEETNRSIMGRIAGTGSSLVRGSLVLCKFSLPYTQSFP